MVSKPPTLSSSGSDSAYSNSSLAVPTGRAATLDDVLHTGTVHDIFAELDADELTALIPFRRGHTE